MAKSLSITVSNDLLRDRRMHRIAHCLQEEGYEVHLLGVQRKDSFALRLKNNYSQNRTSPWFKKSALFYLEINIRFFFRLVKLRPSIVYAVDFDTLLANVFYKRLFRSKIIFDAHEYFTEVPELSNQPFKKLVWHNIGKWGIKHCNLCLTVGTQLSKIFEIKYSHGFNPIFNVPYFHSKEDKKRTPTFVYLGDLNPGRGLENCIRAMQHIDGELKIVGDGPMRQKLEFLTKKLRLESKIKFTGYLLPEELSDELLSAQAGLNLLDKSSLSYYYSLANKFFDYIHHGLPIICSPFPEYLELNKKFDVILPTENSVAEIVDSMESILTNDSKTEKLRRNCFKAAEKVNWQEEKINLIKLIKGI